MTIFNRLLDWLCARLGLCLRFDSSDNLMAPTGDESWWPAAAPSCGTGTRTDE